MSYLGPRIIANFKKPIDPNRKREPKAREKRPGMSPAHLAFIRKLPSAVSGKGPCEAHHLQIKSERGVGLRATDKWSVPVLASEHREIHRFGSKKEVAWFKSNGIENVYELAKALYANTGDEERCIRIIEAHNPTRKGL